VRATQFPIRGAPAPVTMATGFSGSDVGKALLFIGGSFWKHDAVGKSRSDCRQLNLKVAETYLP
jgi:hypothetical protein